MRDPWEAVFFDLDDTLVHDGADEAVRRVAADLALRLPFTEAQILAANTGAWRECWTEQGERWMRGELPGDALPREIWRRTLVALGADHTTTLDEAVALHLKAEQGTFRLYDDTVEVVQGLRARGLLVGVITNGPSDSQRAKIAEVGIDALFDLVVASGDIGVLKPAPVIFERALRGLDVPPARAVHVGDSFAADVVGAVDAGMSAVWINRAAAEAPRSDTPHRDIRSLRELLVAAPPVDGILRG